MPTFSYSATYILSLSDTQPSNTTFLIWHWKDALNHGEKCRRLWSAEHRALKHLRLRVLVLAQRVLGCRERRTSSRNVYLGHASILQYMDSTMTGQSQKQNKTKQIQICWLPWCRHWSPRHWRSWLIEDLGFHEVQSQSRSRKVYEENNLLPLRKEQSIKTKTSQWKSKSNPTMTWITTLTCFHDINGKLLRRILYGAKYTLGALHE